LDTFWSTSRGCYCAVEGEIHAFHKDPERAKADVIRQQKKLAARKAEGNPALVLAKRIIAEQEAAKLFCEWCTKEINGTFETGRFCDVKCRNSFSLKVRYKHLA